MMKDIKNNQPPGFFQLKWIAKLALIIGVAATVSLVLAIYWVTDDKGANYTEIIISHSLTRQHLAPTLLVFGLALILVVAITTWFIVLYSSFRIAGPLFRFSQNLLSIIDNAFATPLSIRKSDLLQREWRHFETSQARLRQHYADLHDALQACDQAGNDVVALNQAIAQLEEVEHRVQL